MNRVGRAMTMFSIGAIMARLLWSGGFGFFVQQRMRIPLLLATIVLLILGTYEAVAGTREQDRDPEAANKQFGPTVGWMLALPLAVLVSVAPTGLGAAAASRVDAFNPTDATEIFEDLDTSDGPVQMRVIDFLDRAIWDDSGSLENVVVRLEGLVVNSPDVPDGFKLTRFMVSCCAADGIPLQVALHNRGPALADETWVVADVMFRPPSIPFQETEGLWLVEADVISLTTSEFPNDPYESPY